MKVGRFNSLLGLPYFQVWSLSFREGTSQLFVGTILVCCLFRKDNPILLSNRPNDIYIYTYIIIYLNVPTYAQCYYSFWILKTCSLHATNSFFDVSCLGVQGMIDIKIHKGTAILFHLTVSYCNVVVAFSLKVSSRASATNRSCHCRYREIVGTPAWIFFWGGNSLIQLVSPKWKVPDVPFSRCRNLPLQIKTT